MGRKSKLKQERKLEGKDKTIRTFGEPVLKTNAEKLIELDLAIEKLKVMNMWNLTYVGIKEFNDRVQYFVYEYTGKDNIIGEIEIPEIERRIEYTFIPIKGKETIVKLCVL